MKPGNRKNTLNRNVIVVQRSQPAQVDPAKYWEHPLYQHLSRRLKTAKVQNDLKQIQEISTLTQGLINNSLSIEQLTRLERDRIEEIKRLKGEKRKKQSKFVPKKTEELSEPQINIYKLKQKIFNNNSSLENVIEAMNKLPRTERADVAKKLPFHLRAKLRKYLESNGLF